MIKPNKYRFFLLPFFVALILLLTSCTSKYSPIEPSEEDLTVVGQIGGKDVYMEELRFVAESNRRAIESKYGKGIFQSEDAEKYLSELKEAIYKNITANYATVILCEEAYVKLGEEKIIAKVDITISNMVDELGGMKKYREYLSENYLTDHFLRFTVEVSLLENELFYIYVDDLGIIENDDKEIFEIIEDDFIAVRHIYIPNTVSDAQEKINQAKLALDGGADFAAVMQEYNHDSEIDENGLFIMRGYMNDSYEDVAFSLGTSDRSEIVSDESGYYIIERIEMDSMRVLLKFNELKELYQTYTLLSIIDEKQAELEFIPNEAGLAYINGLK